MNPDSTPLRIVEVGPRDGLQSLDARYSVLDTRCSMHDARGASDDVVVVASLAPPRRLRQCYSSRVPSLTARAPVRVALASVRPPRQ